MTRNDIENIVPTHIAFAHSQTERRRLQAAQVGIVQHGGILLLCRTRTAGLVMQQWLMLMRHQLLHCRRRRRVH